MAEAEKTAKSGEVVKAGFIAEITLKKPITDQDGNAVTVLQIREPTTQDYLTYGDPYQVKQSGTGAVITGNTEAGMGYLEACTGIHAALLKQLHIHDSMKAIGAITNFFGQA